MTSNPILPLLRLRRSIQHACIPTTAIITTDRVQPSIPQSQVKKRVDPELVLKKDQILRQNTTLVGAFDEGCSRLYIAVARYLATNK